MRVVLYARVSSEKQAEKDLSIPAQLKALRMYALKRNWEIITEYVDEAESARSVNRPAFQEMITAAKKKEKPFDIILVWKLSRFARNREDSIIYKSLLRKRGISLISINEQIDDSAAGKLLEGMIEVIDEFYSANLAQDTMRGMKENVNRGFFNGGIVPFGYKKVKASIGSSQKTKLEPDNVEAPIVKYAFQMAMEGKGGKEIARVLNSEGYRTRSGKLFGTTIINFWLRNPVYTGKLVWNRTDRSNEKPLRKPTNEVIVVSNTHEALVSQDEFDQIQALLASRRPRVRHPRVVASKYLLSGFCFCGKCGAALIGTAAKSGKYPYYECNSRYKKGKDSCDGIRLGKDYLEGFVVSRIIENILTEENLKKLVSMINSELLETSTRSKTQLLQTEKQLTQTSNKLTRLYSALESGKLELEDLAPRIKELRANQKEFQRRRDQLLESVNSEEVDSLDTDTVISHVNELGQILKESSFVQRKTFISSFIRHIEVYPDKIIIDYNLPLPLETNRTSSREVLRIDRVGSGGWIRTNDLRVMSPTSFHCSTPRRHLSITPAD